MPQRIQEVSRVVANFEDHGLGTRTLAREAERMRTRMSSLQSDVAR